MDKNLKYSFFILFLLTVLYSCAQTKGLIKKTQAYSFTRMPGTITKEENDNPGRVIVDTVVLVYAETVSDSVIWDTAWLKGRAYKLVSQLSQNGEFEAGLDKETGKPIILKAGTGCYLYQLYFQAIDQKKKVPAQYEEGKILLRGKYKKQTFYKKTDLPVEIRTYDAM